MATQTGRSGVGTSESRDNGIPLRVEACLVRTETLNSYLSLSSLICVITCIADLSVEQKSERVGRAGTRVGINSVACDPMRPYLFATGGSDPLGEAGFRQGNDGVQERGMDTFFFRTRLSRRGL